MANLEGFIQFSSISIVHHLRDSVSGLFVDVGVARCWPNKNLIGVDEKNECRTKRSDGEEAPTRVAAATRKPSKTR